jgi:hypothetical protein
MGPDKFAMGNPAGVALKRLGMPHHLPLSAAGATPFNSVVKAVLLFARVVRKGTVAGHAGNGRTALC